MLASVAIAGLDRGHLVAGPAAVRGRRGPRLRGPADREPPRPVHAPGAGGADRRGHRGRRADRRRRHRAPAARHEHRSTSSRACPRGADAQAAVAQLEGQFGALPEPLKGISLAVLTEVVTNLQATLQGLVDGLGTFITSQILGILDTVSFVLGLFVIPVWILTVVADEHRIKQRAARLVTPALRADAAGLVRIADRALSTFLRVRVGLGVSTAVMVWIGLIDRARARPRGVPVRRGRRHAAGHPAAHPRARVLPRVLPDPARPRDRRPGPRPHRRGRLHRGGACLVDPPRDPPVPRRARRAPRAS